MHLVRLAETADIHVGCLTISKAQPYDYNSW